MKLYLALLSFLTIPSAYAGKNRQMVYFDEMTKTYFIPASICLNDLAPFALGTFDESITIDASNLKEVHLCDDYV